MMLKSRLAGFISAMLIASSATAHMSAPLKCPSANAIKEEGVSIVFEWATELFITSQISHFDTDQEWLFSLGLVQADTERKALKEGNKLLNHMSGNPIPQEDGEAWICRYSITGNYIAFAFPADDLSPMQRTRQYFVK